MEYKQDFFDLITAGSISSANRLVPLVNNMIKPKSVLDIGGGNGAWLSAWRKNGVKDVLCVDGDYVDQDKLHIPRGSFKSHDLGTPLKLGRKFDLAMSLEVAEHIDAENAKTFVRSLTQHADVVFFSAAMPGQGGMHHVNEQWLSYWAKLFKAQGYDPYDIIRPVIWDVRDIEFWYRQNCIIFATPAAAKRHQLKPSTGPIDIVHPEHFMYQLKLRDTASTGTSLKDRLKKSPVAPMLRRVKRALNK